MPNRGKAPRERSEPRQTEEIAAPRDELYRAMFEENTAIKLLIDPSTGRIIDANPAAEAFYGWSIDMLRTMHITDINILTPAEVRAEMQSARQRRRTYFRFRHRTARGDIRHVEVHSGPVVVGEQELLFSIVHDVTERDRFEEQLQQSQRLEAIGRLAGGIAHDFNNLLTVMLTTAGAMARRVEVGSPLRAYVTNITDAAQRAASLTRELLAFSRRQMMQPRSFQLNQVVLEMEGLVRWTLGGSIELRMELGSSLPVVRADRSRIDQVIMNLILNARDAMPQGGQLTLKTGVVTVDSQAADLVPAGRWVTLSVSDTGTGMDEQTRARLFEPFFTTKSPGEGTGLGLSTAYGVVKQSGGYIAVSSELGKGSEFVVYLPPSATDAEPTLPPSRSRQARPAGIGRVLLVDDVEEVRAALSDALQHAGFEVREASSANDVLEIPETELARFDAVVTDIVMPGRSGIELAVALRERRPELPVLLMSGDVRDHDQAPLPADVRLLQKPFEGDDLARAIIELINETS